MDFQECKEKYFDTWERISPRTFGCASEHPNKVFIGAFWVQQGHFTHALPFSLQWMSIVCQLDCTSQMCAPFQWQRDIGFRCRQPQCRCLKLSEMSLIPGLKGLKVLGSSILFPKSFQARAQFQMAIILSKNWLDEGRFVLQHFFSLSYHCEN